jgi:hypothetical protein
MRSFSRTFAHPRARAITSVIGVLLIATATLAFSALPAQARALPRVQGSLTEFDAPGASSAFSDTCNGVFQGIIDCGTTALANNDSGEVVGTYTDAGFVQHGFLRYPNGYITTFDAPVAGGGPGQGTVAFAVNDAGVIAGTFQDANNVYHGFLRFPDGLFEQVDAPGAGTGAQQGTFAWNVNPSGTTAGTYIDADNVNHGFVRTRADRYASFDPPGSVFTYPCEETCLSPDGTVTGFFLDATGQHGFVRTPSGAITTLDVPNAVDTGAATIKNDGVVAGTDVIVSSGTSFPFLAQGYVRAPGGRLVTFQETENTSGPGPDGINVYSINGAGETTGIFFGPGGVLGGFVRGANGIFTNFQAPGAGTAPFDPNTFEFQGTRPSTNNARGEVAGWYIDSNYVDHGFVWQP